VAEEVELKIAQDRLSMAHLAQPLEDIEQELKNGAVSHILRGEGICKLGKIYSATGVPQVASKRGKAIDALALGYYVKISPLTQHQGAMGQRLYMPAYFACGLAHPLGYGSELAMIGGI
jgi:hypothetical protein